MHKNIYWYVLIATIALAVLWFSGKFLYSYYQYSTLTAKAPVESIAWSVEGLTDEKYVLKARYTFRVLNETKSGEAVISDHHYWNQKAAEMDIPDYAKRKWTAWYNPKNPDHSALQKHFPLKDFLSAVFLWGLIGYFIWLGFYASTYRK